MIMLPPPLYLVTIISYSYLFLPKFMMALLVLIHQFSACLLLSVENVDVSKQSVTLMSPGFPYLSHFHLGMELARAAEVGRKKESRPDYKKEDNLECVTIEKTS